MDKQIVSKNTMVNELIRIGHKDLKIYADIGLVSVREEPELFAHVISWNSKNGSVRDSKVALPIIALRGKTDDELFENAVANLCLLDPRNLLRACYFNKELSQVSPGGSKMLKNGIYMYLDVREKSRRWWDGVAVQHRESLKSLYALNHIKPNDRAQKVLFERDYPKGSVFEQIRNLKSMSAEEAAGTILNHNIPFLVAVGAIGGIKNKPDILLALMERMSGSELINNTAMLKKYGVFESPSLKATYDKAIEKAKKDKRVSTLKAGKAAQVVGDKKVAEKLIDVQEQKIDSSRIEGDWLVLGDRSGSMQTSIAVAKNVAALLARSVKGSVHLVFFNTIPIYINVSGKTLPEIEADTKRITATGGTSVGCGLEYIAQKGIVVDGIAICSDGGDNTRPFFKETYERYSERFGVEPTVYMYHVPGETNYICGEEILPYTTTYTDRCMKDKVELFELGRNVDYYSLPNLVKTMRANKYSLLDDIMETPLLSFNDVFRNATA